MEGQSKKVREVLPEGEGWIKQGGSMWTGRSGDFSATATPLGDAPRESEVSEQIARLDLCMFPYCIFHTLSPLSSPHPLT